MSKRANPMAVKSALTYEIGESAKALGVSKATIRNWIKDGLPVLTSKKPYLISGAEIREYLRAKYRATKSPLGPNQLYCLSCKTGREPLNMTVDPRPNTAKTIRIQGLCSHCGASACRMISSSKVDEFSQTFRFQKNGNSKAY